MEGSLRIDTTTTCYLNPHFSSQTRCSLNPHLSLSFPPRKRFSVTAVSKSFDQVDAVYRDHAAAVNGVDVGVFGDKRRDVMVVLLAWLGAKPKHLKRYVDLYSARGIPSVTFVVPVLELLCFDLGKGVEKRIEELTNELASWLLKSETDGRERCLIFHTFSNTGWLAYSCILDNLRGRPDITDKIKGCVVDSGGEPELNPQVWAAGFAAAMLKKQSSIESPRVEARKQNGSVAEVSRWKIKENKPHIFEIILLALLGKLFVFLLNLPDVKWRLTRMISVLSKNQSKCPQLYLYSTADKVIPFRSVELFMEDQKRMGKTVFSYNFESSPHVEHSRTFPVLYSSELYKFLEECLSPVKKI